MASSDPGQRLLAWWCAPSYIHPRQGAAGLEFRERAKAAMQPGQHHRQHKGHHAVSPYLKGKVVLVRADTRGVAELYKAIL